MTPGQDSGHSGFDWEALVTWLIGRHGTLAGVAEHLAAERGHLESVESIERGLRRLRGRSHGDGGVWGRRCLAAFGLPEAIVKRVQWMGVYHSRFTDLPVPLCADLLRIWDRPPVRGTSAGAWVELGLASVSLRLGNHQRATDHLDTVDRMGARAPIAARIELALVRSFVLSRIDDGASLEHLERADALLAEAGDPCFRARLVDQRGYRLNRPRDGEPRPAEALALYDTIDADGPPFARCRRHNGMGWSLSALGRRSEALGHARAAVSTSGDAGLLRLRAMALRLLADVADGDEAADARSRSAEIAGRLQDDALLWRFRSG